MDDIIGKLEQYADSWAIWKDSDKVPAHPPRPEGYGCKVDRAGVGGTQVVGKATLEEAVSEAIFALINRPNQPLGGST